MLIHPEGSPLPAHEGGAPPRCEDLPSFTVAPAIKKRGAPRAAPSLPSPQVPPQTHPVLFDQGLLDEDAQRVLRRLTRAGYEAYLVGGCVRDLLLQKKPKDFDIATSAHPEQVRSLFRNCRVIGRRFRLAHILFGEGKIIEVATFRRNPGIDTPPPLVAEGGKKATSLDTVRQDFPEGSLLLRQDNVFGEAHEDAFRRDFTINALFYDIDRCAVLDWCGGMTDIATHTLCTIGVPVVRFLEDPIRILRAIKFASRLDFGISAEVYDAMVLCREELRKAARPRVFEEVLRLLRTGASHRAFWILWESGCLAVLLPELASFLDDAAGGEDHGLFWRRLDALDQCTRQRGKPLDDSVLFATLLWDPMEEALGAAQDRNEAIALFLDSVLNQLAVPRRLLDAIRVEMAIQPRLRTGKVGRFGRGEHMAPALDLLEIDRLAQGKSIDLVRMLRAATKALHASG